MTVTNIESHSGTSVVRVANRFRAADVAAMLRRRVHWGIHLGLVKPGDRLPSLRAASSEFGVDQRLVLAAYRELEHEGVVVMRPRSGIYVAPAPQSTSNVPSGARWMSEMFLQGFSRGVPPNALGGLLTGAVTSRPLTAACVECNADQILWMASQLRNEFGLSTTWIETCDLSSEAVGERVAESDFIVTTSFHAAEARKLGEQFDRPVVVATAGRDGITQIRAELGRGPVYFVGTDARYAKKLLEASDSTRWMSNLRPLVADKLHPTAIPAGAPVVVTQAVAEILGDNIPRGAAVFDYPFSTETRGEVIGIMLSAYLKSLEALPPSAQLST